MINSPPPFLRRLINKSLVKRALNMLYRLSLRQCWVKNEKVPSKIDVSLKVLSLLQFVMILSHSVKKIKGNLKSPSMPFSPLFFEINIILLNLWVFLCLHHKVKYILILMLIKILKWKHFKTRNEKKKKILYSKGYIFFKLNRVYAKCLYWQFQNPTADWPAFPSGPDWF